MTPDQVTSQGYLDQLSSLELFNYIDSRIELICGKGNVTCADNDCLVLCVVRNGATYIEKFLEHYLDALDVKHMFFLDNGSTDGTREILTDCRRASVYHSDLPFGVFSQALSRFMVEKFGRNRWTLVVDIDEFFDYPFSSGLSLSGMLDYLNRHDYNVVVTQMLDLFSDRDVKSASRMNEDFRATHVYYDLSDLSREEYALTRRGYEQGNKVSNPEIKFLKGGIRKTIFGLQNVWLTKHSLVRFTTGMSYPHRHIISGGRAADISCVLYHYKFLSHFPEYVDEVLTRQSHVNNSFEYRHYKKTLESPGALNLASGEHTRLISQEELIENGFIEVSDSFKAWASGPHG